MRNGHSDERRRQVVLGGTVASVAAAADAVGQHGATIAAPEQSMSRVTPVGSCAVAQ